MLTWVPEQRILFACDLFGSHLASSEIFVSDEAAILPAAKRYFAEIMMPFRAIIEKNLSTVVSLNPQIIASSHGPVHKRPQFILEAYREWVSGSPKNLVVVPYVSMHDSTRCMIEHFVEACTKRGVIVEQIDLTEADIGKLAMLLVDAAGIVFGSPMVLAGPHPKVAYAALLTNALRPKAKFFSVIGSFGWGGRLTETIQSLLPNLKAELLPPVLAKGLPKEKDYAAIDALAAAISSRVEFERQQARAASESSNQFSCTICSYVYDPAKGDPDGGIPPGTPFERIPDDWICPICRVPKKMFRPV
jgi:flavorubredoxin/rubredoxin